MNFNTSMRNYQHNNNIKHWYQKEIDDWKTEGKHKTDWYQINKYK